MSHKFPSHVLQIEANYFHVDEDSGTKRERERKMHGKYNRIKHNEWNDKTWR